MERHSRPAAWLVLLAALPLISGRAPAQAGATVTGRVTLGDGGPGLSMIAVTLEDPASPLVDTAPPVPDQRHAKGKLVAMSDPRDGRFEMTGVPAGTWRLACYAGTKRVGEPLEVVVTDGQPCNVDVALTQVAVTRGRLTAQAGGQPIVGAMVALVRPPSYADRARTAAGGAPEDYRMAVTQADGAFALVDVLPGDWGAVIVGGAAEPHAVGTVTVTGQPGEVLELRAPHTPAHALRILDADGAPVANAETKVWLRRDQGYPFWNELRQPLTTAADGRIELPSAELGRMGVDRVDVVALVCTGHGWATIAAPALRDAAEAPAEVRLQPGGTVRARCRGTDGAARAGLSVVLRGTHAWEVGNQSRTADTGADGLAVFADLPPGIYDVDVHSGRAATQSVILTPGDDVVTDVWIAPDHDPASVGPRGPGAGAPAAGELSGAVVAADGGLPGAVSVMLDVFPLDGAPAGSGPRQLDITDGTGSFRFESVDTGYHVLGVVSGGRTVALRPLRVPPPDERQPVTIAMSDGFGGVAGRVVDAASGQGVAGVTVLVVERHYLFGSGQQYAHNVYYDADARQVRPGNLGSDATVLDLAAILPRATSDAEGRYEIPGLLPGAYVLIAIDEQQRRDEHHPIVVRANETTGAPNLRLPSADGIPLVVRLVTESGEAVPGEHVEVVTMSGPPGGGLRPDGPADGSGRVTLAAGCPGWYGFSLRLTNGAEARCWGVAIPAAGEAPGVTLTVSESGYGEALVQVLTADGGPFAGPAWVVPLLYRPGQGSFVAEMHLGRLADERGRCEVKGLRPGTYAFVARTPSPAGTDGLGVLMGLSDTVVVTAGAPADATAVLEPCSRIAGRVTAPDGSALTPLCVSANQNYGMLPGHVSRHSVVTDEAGEFVLDGLHPARWSVQCQPWGAAEGLVFPSTEVAPTPGEMTWLDVMARDVSGADPAEAVEPSQYLTATGRVVWPDGRPATGVTVGSSDSDWGIPKHSTTADDGSFCLAGLPRWGAGLFAWTPDGISARVSLDGFGAGGGAGDPGPVELVLQPARSVRGRVLMEADDPASGALEVMAVLADRRWATQELWPGEGSCARAKVDPDGSFSIGGLASGEYQVQAVWGNLVRSAPVTIEIIAGDAEGLSLAVPPLIPELRVALQDADGQPLARGLAVSVSVHDMHIAGNLPLVAGNLVLSQVPPGRYSFHGQSTDNRSVQLGSADVTPETAEVTVRQPATSRLEGKVVVAQGLALHDALRVAVSREGDWLGYSTRYASIGPDGSYKLTADGGGELEVCLVAGRATRLAVRKVSLQGEQVTQVPDLVYEGSAAR